MEGTPIKVGVNGYGVIGKRVADAIALQPDMELAGVADVATDYRVALARERGYKLFGSTSDAATGMGEASLAPVGSPADLLEIVDVVVDATLKNVGAANKPAYEAAGVKAIFQGGEKHELAGTSFVAQANYDEALGKDFVRAVSCNTTGLIRVLSPLRDRGLVARARAVLVRRGTDPWESHEGGMINTLLPERKVPSHQGPDARTVIRDLDVVTMAAAGPFNLSHVHFAWVEAPREVEREEVMSALRDAARIVFVRADRGVPSAGRGRGRSRSRSWAPPVPGDPEAAVVTRMRSYPLGGAGERLCLFPHAWFTATC